MNAPYQFEPDTDITLCNVPWDKNYHNVVGWTSQAAKDTYFNQLYQLGHSYRFVDSTYCPVGKPIVIDLPYSVAYQYNYCYIVNPPQVSTEPVEGDRTYYYFITSCEYLNPASCLVRLQLDVWTTYYDGGALFGNGFLEQGHIGMANRPVWVPGTDGTFPALSRYLSQPEDIDTGDVFYTVKADTYSLQQDTGGTLHDDYVIIMSTADLSKPFGTIDNPSLNTASGDIVDGLYSGCNIYITNSRCIRGYLISLQSYSWVAQCIISLTVVPYDMLREFSMSNSDFNGQPTTGTDDDFFKTIDSFQTLITWDISLPLNASIKRADIVADTGFVRSDIADIHKLWMYPYTVIELTTFDGSSLIIRPQDLYLDNTVLDAVGCAVPPFLAVAIYPRYYARAYGSAPTARVDFCNASQNVGAWQNPGYYDQPTGDFLDSAVWIRGFPSFSIVNNEYITYMASTANTRQWSYDNASWSLTSAGASASTAYDLQRASLATSQANFEVDQENQRTNLVINTAANGINALIDTGASALTGNIPDAVSTALHAVVTEGANVWTSLNNFETQRQIQANNIGLGQMQSDANLSLANFVNAGNYANAVRGIQAGYRDAQLRPPSVAGQVGGDGLRYARGLLFAVTVRVKRVNADAQVRAAQYFRRFGYRVNRFVEVPANLNIAEHFTYYKFQEVNIISGRADIPEDYRDALRGIMCRGVTVWSNPYEIGAYDSYIWQNTIRQSAIDDYFD